MLTLILRSIIIYCIVLFAVRLMGKRQIGDLQPFELVITLIIADLACIPISDVTIPLFFGIVPLFTLVILHYFFTLLNRKSIFFRKLLNGRPIIVIDKEGINYNALKKLNMTLNDLMEGLRTAECFNLVDVAYAIVETNGNISVLKKNFDSENNNDNFLNIILINDGKIVKENLENTSLDFSFINKIIKKEKSNIKDVLIMTINSSGEIYFQEKNKKYKILYEKVNI